MKKITFLFFFISSFFATSMFAQNYELRFDIVNHTGLSLYGIYVTDTNTNNWGDDIIPYDRFEDNTMVNVSIPIDNQTLCAYDIRIADDAQNSVEFTNVDFCELQVLTLLMDENGNLYYIVE
ncbi:hypothetical protein [Aequorivita sp. CIP111184]|uniref:hypothetical protein n=1 Tax=Aequorivita sp. CIP111184 TaxID=2211356 RepID=UPI000DBBE295|nr:hypothetical protein [Aequorivita sp. CIP111184]SRX54928.1 hypothetical protein AEQU1_01948 [Aequorivita sp. CIP111184]